MLSFWWKFSVFKSILHKTQKLFQKIIYLFLFLAVLGLCCVRAFSSCSGWELLFIAVLELLTAVASFVEHRLWALEFQ